MASNKGFSAVMVRKTIDESGNILYFNEKGQYHREDGPAIQNINGDVKYFINDTLHRVGGPAITHCNGKEKEWWKNNKRHRLNAGAVIYKNIIQYYEFGIYIKTIRR